jgi:hypothetical protein
MPCWSHTDGNIEESDEEEENPDEKADELFETQVCLYHNGQNQTVQGPD